jgi:hypothetical protein
MEQCLPTFLYIREETATRLCLTPFTPILLSYKAGFILIRCKTIFFSVQFPSTQQLFSIMHLDKHGYVSIVELIVFIPCLILSFVVCRRHGFKRTSGWIFILILSAIRIAGAICQLLTYDNPTEGLIKATLILDSIGIAPLLLALLGVLSRL